jgi:fused signal recognition particle receptor
VFDLLKKKISGFVRGVSEAVGAKREEAPIVGEEKGIPAPAGEPVPAGKEIIAPAETLKQVEVEEPKIIAAQRPVETPAPAEIPKPTVSIAEEPRIAAAQKPVETPKTVIVPAAEEPKPAAAPPAEKKRDISPDLGLFSKLKGMLTNQVEITEPETRQMFDELELALLESDVSPDTSQALVAQLKKSLVGRKVARSEVEKTINEAVAAAITSVFSPAPDVIALARQKKARGEVLKIMFLGPNGAGKTTTIAKLSSLFKQNGLDVVVSASDTFRAAAIEQAAVHADRLGIKLVKQSYGADPAAVAFDAIRHAQAAGAAVVLIDTAGRQETNRNLVEEMRKIDRVAKPDCKIFIGEALAGHALVEQVRSFDAAVGVDGIILTKLDCDAKGGNSISIAHDAAKPIMFFGVGQGYGDLVPFDPGYVAAKVLEA